MKKQILLFSLFISFITIGNAQVINFPDTIFKNILLDKGYDSNADGDISIQEAEQVTYISFYNYRHDSPKITDLEGIEFFTNLKTLRLHLHGLTSVDLSKNILLENLQISANNLTEIDVSSLVFLEELDLSDNNITEIDISNLSLLNDLDLARNNLTFLDARFNSISSIQLVQNNNLKELFLTNQPLSFVGVGNTPNLEFICADQEYLDVVHYYLELTDHTSTTLSTDCLNNVNITIITSNITYDVNNDGCGNADDIPFTKNIPIHILSGSGQPVTAYSNDEGLYKVFLPDGSYKFIPDLAQYENYFQVYDPPVFNPFDPNNLTAVPDDINNLRTNFCIQPVGDFNDLEVAIYPISSARPGFDAYYEIMYTNTATTTQSGTVTLDYDDDVLTFKSSTPNVTSNANGQLTWSFSNLAPMETATIPFSFTLNTPTDSPALNSADILNFTATVIGATDETPEDNVMTLAQTVVNSYDPNDKTCLEGDILDPEDVGNYLHYLIRFENEGTANAINITVTDKIDTTKFDIESFVPLKSSHSYTTTISNENEVEFLFSDINLPFDDANNDGYVLFKIKTLDTLVEGDEIVNSAAIYFDFNFPIITEDSVVEVKTPEEPAGPEFSDYFIISPNPTTGVINLEVLDDSIEISYILLYDLNGVFRGFFHGSVRTIDITDFYARTYIMQILTNKGDFSTQFIKL